MSEKKLINITMILWCGGQKRFATCVSVDEALVDAVKIRSYMWYRDLSWITVRMIWRGNVEDSKNESKWKSRVVSVVLVSTEEEGKMVKNKLGKNCKDKNWKILYGIYVTPLDIVWSLTSLEHYPSIEISKMIYK